MKNKIKLILFIISGIIISYLSTINFFLIQFFLFGDDNIRYLIFPKVLSICIYILYYIFLVIYNINNKTKRIFDITNNIVKAILVVGLILYVFFIPNIIIFMILFYFIININKKNKIYKALSIIYSPAIYFMLFNTLYFIIKIISR